MFRALFSLWFMAHRKHISHGAGEEFQFSLEEFSCFFFFFLRYRDEPERFILLPMAVRLSKLKTCLWNIQDIFSMYFIFMEMQVWKIYPDGLSGFEHIWLMSQKTQAAVPWGGRTHVHAPTPLSLAFQASPSAQTVMEVLMKGTWSDSASGRRLLHVHFRRHSDPDKLWVL